MSVTGSFNRNVRAILGVSLLSVLAACNSTDTKGLLGSAGSQQTAPAMVQGKCPQIVLREGTAVHQVYARGARKMPDGSLDPQKLVYQAAIADTTRACSISEAGLTITVQAQGRIVQGAAGKPGTYNLPIRVAVADNTAVLYSELTQLEVQIPAGQLSNQFFFQKTDVNIPGGAGDFATIYLGFDDGPQKKKK